jgi:hypothetical protein
MNAANTYTGMWLNICSNRFVRRLKCYLTLERFGLRSLPNALPTAAPVRGLGEPIFAYRWRLQRRYGTANVVMKYFRGARLNAKRVLIGKGQIFYNFDIAARSGLPSFAGSRWFKSPLRFICPAGSRQRRIEMLVTRVNLTAGRELGLRNQPPFAGVRASMASLAD